MTADRLKTDATELRAIEDKIAALTERLADMHPGLRTYEQTHERRRELMVQRRAIIARQTAAGCSRG